ncbi:MAG: signal recognition particle protein, partial [Desulfobacterales bacterium]|nr:signal recognition particle protein [Desulfobacterales bacterium]
RKSQFTLEDFKDQLLRIRKMGSFAELLNMIPGFSKNKQFKNLDVDEKELIKIEAIINSMTPQERRNYNIINGSRRKRIASGSGTTVQDINKLLKNYDEVMKMIKKLTKSGPKALSRGLWPF